MGGYDIRATSSTPLANLTILQVQSRTPEEPATRVALLNSSRIEFYDGLFAARAGGLTVNGQPPTNQGSDPNTVYGIDANFTTHTTYRFKDALSYFSSPKEVWASLRNPRYAIVDASYSYGANGTEVRAGDIITVQTANSTARFVVAGVLDEFYLHGIFLSKQQVHRLFPAITGDTLFLIKSESGMKPIELSYDLKKDYKVAGVDAFLIRDELLQMTQQNQLLFQLVATYLGLGLIVGIASVGVTTLRSIRERRQEIGVMRAIGFTRGLIIQSLLLEAIFGTTLASIIGLSAGLTVSYAIYLSFGEAIKAAFAVPVTTLLTIFSVVYLATVICTVIPARNASRTSPAEAIRYGE
jgi:putative ABC transport system permease protein